MYSDNACVVIKASPVDEFDLTSIPIPSNGSPRHMFTDLHKVLESCPFDPVLIEFTDDLKLDDLKPIESLSIT